MIGDWPASDWVLDAILLLVAAVLAWAWLTDHADRRRVRRIHQRIDTEDAAARDWADGNHDPSADDDTRRRT